MRLWNFFNSFSFFGLDISDFSLKIAQLEKNKEGFSLVSFGQKKIPKGIIEKAEVTQPEALAEIIQEAIKKVKGRPIRTRYVVASLPEEKAFVRVIQMPKMTQKEVAQAIKWEVEANIPMPLNEVYFDWRIIPPYQKTPHYTYVLVMAMPKKTVDGYLNVLNKAGLKALALEVESLALVRSLIKGGQTSHPVIILDLGATGTGLTIFAGQTISFTSHIPVSGQDFEKAIAKSCQVDLKEARKLKIEVGLNKKKLNGRVYQALIPVVNRLVEHVQHHLDFYHSHGVVGYAPDGIVEKILLCGGDSLLIGLPQYLTSQLRIQTELANPWVNILNFPLKETPQLPYQKSLAYSTALGLALRGLI